MKQPSPAPARNAFRALMLLGMLQLSVHSASAQEQQINISLNNFQAHPNLGNNPSSNVNVVMAIPSRGPNGLPAQTININVADNNGPGPNVGGPNMREFIAPVVSTPVVVAQVSNKPKPVNRTVVAKPVRRTVTAPQKPKPVVAVAATTQRPKPKAPSVGAAVARRPVTRPATPAPAALVQAPAPVNNPPAPVVDVPVVVQQMQNDNALVVIDNVSPAPDQVINTTKVAAVKRSMSFGGSGSSSSSGKLHHSKSKKHKSFSYTMTKKMNKLFARAKKKKIDPAKCFAWK